MKIAFIINGSRKMNRKAALTLKLAKEKKDLVCQFFVTTKSKQAIEFAENAGNQNFDIVVAVGGDGTCNEVVNGIQRTDRKKEIYFGLIPNGTGNDFQKMISYFDPQEFVHSLISLNHKTIDLIQVSLGNNSRYSINISGVGFDGFVVSTLEKMRTKLRLKGQIAYSLAILKSFLTFKKFNVRLKSEEFTYSGKLLLMAVCNGKAFGHGILINSNAKMDDGTLEAVVFGNVSFFDYLKNLSKLKKGQRLNHPGVFYCQTKSVTITSEKDVLLTETDGELLGHGNCLFEIVPAALKLIT